MRRERKPQIISNAAVASNPGRLEVQFSVFCRCYPRAPVVIGGCLGVPLAMTLFLHPAFAIGTALLALGLIPAYTGHARDHFWFGCINPAVVVSHDPDLIAVHTDLSTGIGPYPVIKVLTHPLEQMTGGRPAVGTRLGAIALYQGPVRQQRQHPVSGATGRRAPAASQRLIFPPHWDDFHPVAANCATANQKEIERVLSSIPAKEWEALEVALQQVSAPYSPGLYPVELPEHLR